MWCVIPIKRLWTSLILTAPSQRTLYDFKMGHPISVRGTSQRQDPIGLLTTIAGGPVDIRDIFTINTNQYIHEHNFDFLKHFINSRIPAKVVHPKGAGAWRYFVLENDVSNYTSADVFNGVGKITPIIGRFSVGVPDFGVADTNRDFKGLAVKFFTKEEEEEDTLCV